MNIKRLNISLAVYGLLQCFHPTTATAERCFSMLRMLLAKERNFKVENVKECMIYISIPPDDCRVGCIYKVCILQVLLRICVF